MHTESLSEYRTAWSRLVADPLARAALGERTWANIEEINTGAGWPRALEAVYDRAFDLAPRVPDTLAEAARPSDLEAFLPFVFGHLEHRRSARQRFHCAIEVDLRILPPKARLEAWLDLELRRCFVFCRTAQAWRYLLPEWLAFGLKDPPKAWR